MEYKHKRTGVIVSVKSEISGDWERVDAPKSTAEKPKRKQVKK